MIRESFNDRVLLTINNILLTAVLLLIAYPLYFVVIASVSDPTYVNAGRVFLFPRGVSLQSYQYVFEYEKLWTGYGNTIILTAVGTLINLSLTFTCAYALSKTNLPGIRFCMFLLTFTMFFGGGLIPTYLLVTGLGLRNTLWALILPGAVSVYNVILVRTYYLRNIPEELIQAGKIDGCNEYRTFLSIVLPLSTPILATMALFYGVGHWNQYFSAMIYISDRTKYPLQLVLREILLVDQQATSEMLGGVVEASAQGAESLAALARRAEILKYAIIIVSSLPVLIVYPFLQRFFLKGILMGSLKG